jgi:hypothetical protein
MKKIASCGSLAAAMVWMAFGAAYGCSGNTDDPAPIPVGPDASTDGAGGKGGSGGTGGTGGDAGGQCSTIKFAKPVDGAQLTAADDLNGNCADGFQYTVEVATSAPNGTATKLFANSQQLGSGTVMAGKAVFTSVTLDSNGPTQLTAQIGDASCKATANITVACDAAAPSCSLSKPVISADHPALNGIPVAEGGDRVSAPEAPYAAAFEVTSNAGSGGTVALTVDGKAAGTAQVVNGKAVFASVVLSPDNADPGYKVQATCKKQSGSSGVSSVGSYPVDSTAPELVVTGVVGGQTVGVADDVDPAVDGVQFDVCGTTTSQDAMDLEQSNFCVKVGQASAQCQKVLSESQGKSCVRLDCNALGSAAQDLTATLRDWAGNPAVFAAASIKCDTTVPTVSIVEPIAYDPQSASPFILNRSKDQDASQYGLQYTVVACTNAAVGTEARLMAAKGSAAFAQVGANVQVAAAQSGDGCSGTVPNVAKFAAATLPESEQNADGTLLDTTKLRVELELGGKVFPSLTTDAWVDSLAPNPYVVNLWDPVANKLVFCGSTIQSLVAVTGYIRAGCDNVIPIAARVTHQDSTVDTTAAVVASGIVQIDGASYKTGDNTVVITGTDPAGNTGESAPCMVHVGKPPVLSFTAPTNSQVFNLASTDSDPSTPGFQVNVTLTTDDQADAVSLKVNGVDVGAPVMPSGSSVLFPNVTLPEGDAVALEASQVSGTGTANPTVTVAVDLHAPTAVTGAGSSVTERRAATGSIQFNAPSDYDPLTQGQRAAGLYQLRYLTATSGADCSTVLTDATFATAQVLSGVGLPAAPGTAETRSIPGLMTGRSYCVGMRALDNAGNAGPLATFPVISPAWESLSVAAPSGISSFGQMMLGNVDLDGDGFYDLAVAGEPSSVFIYYGSANGLEQQPSVRIQGPAGTLFGVGLSALGNFDASTEAKPLPELAIGAPMASGQGAVYVFSLPASLHASSLTTIQIGLDGNPVGGSIGARFVIKPDGSVPFNNSFFGFSVENVGDFDGDTVPDLVVGAFMYNGGAGDTGRAFLVRGRAAPALTTLSMPGQSEIEFRTSAPGSTFGMPISALGNSGLTGGGGTGGVCFGVNTASAGAGALYAIAGQPVSMGAHLVWNVATVASATALGAGTDNFGGAVSLVGDVDGDGYDDYLAGNYSAGGYRIAYIVYGGPSWGSNVAVQNDVGATNDGFPNGIAKLGLGNPLASRLNGDNRADAVFNTQRFQGTTSMAVWVMPGRAKLTAGSTISALGIRPALPAGTHNGWAITYAPGAAGNDAWPDIILGDPQAPTGRFTILY